MMMTDATMTDLPRWSVADVHESLDSRSFTDALEQARADSDRLVALFDELDIRATDTRPVTADDGAAADRADVSGLCIVPAHVRCGQRGVRSFRKPLGEASTGR